MILSRYYLLSILITIFVSCNDKPPINSTENRNTKFGRNDSLFTQYKLAFTKAKILIDTSVQCYIILPGTGCHGCISNVESFLKNNYAKYNTAKFILTKIQSKKLLKVKLGIDLNHKNIILDSLNYFNSVMLASIYPVFLFINTKGEIIEIRQASPTDNGLEKFIASVHEMKEK